MKPISNQRRDVRVTIPPKGSTKGYRFPGSYLTCLTNTTTADVLCSVDDGPLFPLRAGTGLPTVRRSEDGTTHEPAIYSVVTFDNPTDEYMTVEVVLSLGAIQDTRAVVQGYIQVDLSAPIIDTPAAYTVKTDVKTIIASNALLKERMLQNNGDFPVWVGDENVNPSEKRGLRIVPNGMANFNCWGAVYMLAELGETTISILEVRKVI